MWGLIRVLGLTGGLRLVFRLMLDSRVPLGLKMVIPAAMLYIISPIDLVHDFLPFGRFDDIAVALIALVIFIGMAPRDVVLEHFRGSRPDAGQPGAGDKERGGGPDVIEGSYRFDDDDQQPRR